MAKTSVKSPPGKLPNSLASKSNPLPEPQQKKQPNYTLYLALIVALTALVFWGVTSYDFVNYDDELYIKYNPLLRSLTLSNISDIFFTTKGIYGGNYHPLVTLTNAIEYSMVGYNAWLYHVDNLAIHLINTVLVYVFVLKMSGQKHLVALLVALFFGIHPMHVESVVWVSERKDVLYSLFYLLSMIQFLRYLDQNKPVHYGLSLLYFLLALLCKSMAVTLPLVLWAITWHKGKVDRSFYLRSIPFMALSLVFGGIAIYSQAAQNYIGDYHYSVIDKLFVASYSWAYYVVSMIAPAGLSVLHPFPKHGLSPAYYASILLIIAGVIGVIKLPGQRKLLLFGLLFYTFSIVVVLQIISVGAAVVSERYTYLSYIGLFYIVAVLLEKWYVQQKQIALAVVLVLTGGMCYASVSRIKVWEDGETLWRDATTKNPTTADYAWYGLGNILRDKKADAKEVVNAYDRAIEINPGSYLYLVARGVAKGEAGDARGGIKDMSVALNILPGYADALYDRGNIYKNLQLYDSAMADYTNAIHAKPNYLEPIFNRGIVYKMTGKYDSALADYNRVLTIDPSYINAYTNAGNIYVQLKKYDLATALYTKGIAYDGKQAGLYMSRGMTYYFEGKKAEACADFKTADQLGDKSAAQAILSLCR